MKKNQEKILLLQKSYFGRAPGSSPPHPPGEMRLVERRPSAWDEFCSNGGESQPLDDLDRHLRGMPAILPLADPRGAGYAPYSPRMQGGGAASSLMQLGGVTSSPINRGAAVTSSPTNPGAALSDAVKDIIAKANLIDILREREQRRRVSRGVAAKRVIVPSVGTSF